MHDRAARAAMFPSDLRRRAARRIDPHASVRVCGRVLMADSAGLLIGDAFFTIRAYGASALEAREGDWVIACGRWHGEALREAVLELRQAAPSPRGNGELSRLVFRGVGAHLAARARAAHEVRCYFEEQGFLEVETPTRVPAPGVDLNVEAFAAQGEYLITSPELEMKRLVVGGIPRLFQLARVSRADEAGALHEAEFTLLEWYRAFADYEDVLVDTEAVVRRIATQLGSNGLLTNPAGRSVRVDRPFERISMSEAFRRYAGVDDVAQLSERDEARYFELLIERVEPALARAETPVFLMEYPISQAALARACPHDPRYAERFELYAAGVELCNGYGELTCPVEQRRRFEAERARRLASGLPVYPIHERFLAALEEGMPPTAGNALGFDRLLMLALGARKVQDVMAFPRERL